MFSFVNLWELSEHTLFDEIKLPTGTYTHTNPDGTYVERTITPDKDILVNSILDEVAEFQPITIDVNVMKMKINNFFLKNNEGFNRLIGINLLTYSPIENTDRYESHSNELKRGGTVTNEMKLGSKEVNTDTRASYESEEFKNANQSTLVRSGSDTNTTTNDIKDEGSETIHTHGNIGVTTNQQMMEQELNFWKSFSFYKIVADKFLFELCLTCDTY
jgi:hypothetical protein